MIRWRPSCDRTFASLAPGAVQTYTCTVVVGQNDFTNVANVTGTPPVGPNVTDSDHAVVDVIHPAIDIRRRRTAAGAGGRHGDLHHPGGEHG